METRLRSELRRKAVHVGMGGFALLFRWLTPLEAAACAGLALLFNLFLLHRLTRRSLLRASEAARGYSLGIALYPAVVLATILVFHRRLELAAAVWALLAFGDGMATIAGLAIGRTPLPWNRRKTWSGFLAFVVFGTAAAALLLRWTQRSDAAWIGDSFLSHPGFLVIACFAAALLAAFAESIEHAIDDNLVVPIVGGAALWAATLVEPGRLADAMPVMVRNAGIGAAVNAVLALAAFAARGVSVSGALSGFLLGTLLYTFAGWPGFAILLAFFVLGTGATKLGFGRKAALGVAQAKGGRRGVRNVVANGGAGLLFAFLAAATGHRTLCLVALAAAFATAAADTVSSEIGQAFGRRHVLITSFRRVPAGTDGAVSIEGTLAGVAAAAIVAAIALSVAIVDARGAIAVVLGAIVGTTLESYLGATLETDRVLDNEVVNFANTVAGALAAAAIYAWLRP
jgi:uncharacterized protein (TIGR00297 family)